MNGSIPGTPTSFEAAVDIALNTDFNFTAARFGTHGYKPDSSSSFNSFNRPEPMDLSLAETDEEAELQAVEKILISDDVSRSEAQSICALVVLYVRQVRLRRDELPPRTRSLARR